MLVDGSGGCGCGGGGGGGVGGGVSCGTAVPRVVGAASGVEAILGTAEFERGGGGTPPGKLSTVSNITRRGLGIKEGVRVLLSIQYYTRCVRACVCVCVSVCALPGVYVHACVRACIRYRAPPPNPPTCACLWTRASRSLIRETPTRTHARWPYNIRTHTWPRVQ